MKRLFTLSLLLISILTGYSQSVSFSGKVFLQGAYNTATGTMNNTLNSLGILQANAAAQPYNIPAFDNYAGTESVGAGFFAAHPDIVDWILVELRESSLLSSLVSRRAAFVKTDGSIVDTNGTGAVTFGGVPAARYAVAIRHRNHMGVIADTAVNFTSGSGSYDFTSAANKSLQIQPYTSTVQLGTIWAMRGGDANRNANVKYNGPGNDQNQILNVKLGGSLSNIVNNVYAAEDINMNGNIKWNGPGNDQNFLLNTTLQGSLSNVFNEQLPKGSAIAKIEGLVILPAGTPYIADSLRIETTRQSVRPVNSQFTADVTYDYSTFFAINGDSNIVLMRYNYPGQPNYNLNVQSTALALVMNSNSSSSLESSSKLMLINTLLVHPDFINLSTEIEKAIKSGVDYLQDTTNTPLLQALSKVFTTVSNFRTTSFNPLRITNIGRDISFVNNWGAAYAIGIYKGSNLIEMITLPGVQPFATSVKEILQGYFGDGYTSLSQKIYTLPAVDGNYLVKLRSGKPGSDYSEVWEKALRANIDKAIKDLYDAFVPIPDECMQALRESLVTLGNSYKNHLNRTYTSVSDLAEAIYDLAMTHIKEGNFVLDCGYVKEGGQAQKYLAWLKKLAKYLDIPGKVGTSWNIGFATAGLYYADPVIDTCFTVSGSTVVPCNTLKVALNGQIVSSEVAFNSSSAQAFTLYNADGTMPPAIDYNLVSISNNSNNQVVVSKTNTSSNFSLTLSITGLGSLSTTFDVLYNGKLVQNIRAVVNREPASIVIISGNNQFGGANSSLPNPLTVEVRDNANQAIEGVKIDWKVESGGGQVLLNETFSGASGQSTNGWQLGAAGSQLVSAIVKKSNGSNVTNSPVSFLATIGTNEPASVSIVSGNNQTGPFGTNLSSPLIVVVKDNGGEPMSGITVTWTRTSGGGSLAAATSLTDVNGQATNTWKLGYTGTQSVTATVKKGDGTNITGSPATFAASILTPVIKSYALDSWTCKGCECIGSNMHQTGTAKMIVQFDVPPDPQGQVYQKASWSSGYNGFTIQVKNMHKINDTTYAFTMGVCWGTASTVLFSEIMYYDFYNNPSNTIKITMPRP